ncbi:hypothetical protein CHUAL_009237 [Chamberlinius hualienensis]
MAAVSGGVMSCFQFNKIKSMLEESHSSFKNADDIVELAKLIVRGKEELLSHGDEFNCFYSSFLALAAHYIPLSAINISSSGINDVGRACEILFEYFFKKLVNYDAKCGLTKLEIISLVKGLCKGGGALHLSDVMAFVNRLKSADIPEVWVTGSKFVEENKEAKRSQRNPCNVIFEHLKTPLSDLENTTSDTNEEVRNQDTENFTSTTSASPKQGPYSIFVSRNRAIFHQLNAGEQLVDMCLKLPFLSRYVEKCKDFMDGNGCFLITASDASNIKNSFQSLLNDVTIVWNVVMLPVFEPLLERRIERLLLLANSCICAAVNVAVVSSITALSNSSTQKLSSTSKDDDAEVFAIGAVEKSLDIWNNITLAINQSPRVGRHIYQNLQVIASWMLLSGLQRVLCMGTGHVASDKHKEGASKLALQSQTKSQESVKLTKESDVGASGRQNLLKVQHGFGVLAVGLANHTLQLLTKLFDDLEVEALTMNDSDFISITSSTYNLFDTNAHKTSWERIQKLESNFHFTNIFFNIGAISYRKACALKRVEKHMADDDAFNSSESSSYCEDISWSDGSSGDGDDSEPILGHWFEETITQKSVTSNTGDLKPEASPDASSQHGKEKCQHLEDGHNLVPDRGEPNGFISLAAKTFNFMNRIWLSSNCQVLRNYLKNSISEQHMIILAGIIRDLDCDVYWKDSGDGSNTSALRKLYNDFSVALSKYSHNLFATGLLSESLQDFLLNQLGVSPWQTEDWPLYVPQRTLAIIAQIFLLRQYHKKDELRSDVDPCVMMWQKLIKTLEKCILLSAAVTKGTEYSNTPTSSTSDGPADVNVEHAQLLLLLFHSMQLMQKKSILLELASTIMRVSSAIEKPMNETQILAISRLMIIFEYILRNLYEAPAALVDQVQSNLFTFKIPSGHSDLEATRKVKCSISCKNIEDNYSLRCLSDDIPNGGRPKFYYLTNAELSNQDVPKLDGFSSNFLLGTPDILSYSDFYNSVCSYVKILRQIDNESRSPDTPLSFLGYCAVEYCFSITWRLLLILPPSSDFVQKLISPVSGEYLKLWPLSIIWVPRTSHPSFASWLKDCFIRQGLTTQSADSLIRTLSKTCHTVTYEISQTNSIITEMISKYKQSNRDVLLPKGSLPSFFDLCVLDTVISKMQASLDEAFTKSNTESKSDVAASLVPCVLQLIEFYVNLMRTTLLNQANDIADPPGSYSYRCLAGYSLTMSLMSSRCAKTSSLSSPLKGYLPTVLRNLVDKWNSNVLSEYPASGAWRNAYANDPVPSESYVCAIQMCHVTALSSQPKYFHNWIIKHTLHVAVRFAGDLLAFCQDEKLSSSIVEALFPLVLDVTLESLADLVSMTLERLIGSSDSDEYAEKVFYQVFLVVNKLLKEYSDKESGLDEHIFHDLLQFIDSQLDKSSGKKALERFLKNNDFGSTLLVASNHLSALFGRRALKLLNKLFLASDKTSDDISTNLTLSIDKLCSSNNQLINDWLEKLLMASDESNEDSSIVSDNLLSMQSFATCVINYTQDGSVIAVEFLKVLISIATKLLSSKNGVGFPELMVTMTTLADAGNGIGHVLLLKSACGWLSSCCKDIVETSDKTEIVTSSGKSYNLLESVCCILTYIADVFGALRINSLSQTVAFRSSLLSPTLDTFPCMEMDTDWTDDAAPEEESAEEDSDEDSLPNKLCTFTVTQKEFMNQHWYHCHTCMMVDGVGVCTVCAKVCHKDHDVTYAKYGSFFCDCGAKEDGSCQALVKRTSSTITEAEGTSMMQGAFSSNVKSDSGIRQRSSSPGATDNNGSGKTTADECLQRRQTMAKLLQLIKDKMLSSINLSVVLKSVLEMLQELKPTLELHCLKNSSIGKSREIQLALEELHLAEKTFETTDQLMVPTLGSQEGAFENVRMNYSGDHGQTIRQLIGAHMIRRVAMCVLASPQGKRQHLAVSHEKGKITVLQLSSLLRQADSSKRKLTLTRLASAPIPFTVISLSGNPCNESFVAVCGLKDCHILTFTSSGSISDHVALQPQAAIGNFIIKAIWLPGSQTELALVMPDFVKIYDLSVDAFSPQYYFLLPSGKIRDCTFMVTGDGQRHMILISSAGYLYTQQLCEESSAKHGPFYVTNIIEMNHPDLIDYNGQTSGGGVSVYYSHALQLLFFSFVHGKNFLCPLPKMVYDASKLHPVSFKINGGSKTNNQPLWEWSEVLSHPGLIFCLAQANNNPVVLMVKPNTVLIQEIKIVSTKTKITDMVAIRHQTLGGDHRTTVILLCEDGSLKIYMTNVEQTKFWLKPSHHVALPTSSPKSTKKKLISKLARPSGTVAFPVDFFEHCQLISDVEFGGNDVLEIYNTQQIRHRLNTTGMYIASTKPNGFTLEVINPDSSMVMTGVRIMVGGQDIQRAPSYIEIFNRSIQVTLARSRWYDFPFTKEESLQADKKISILFGPSTHSSGVTIVDTVKVYGKTKESFGWPEETDELSTVSPSTVYPSTNNFSGDFRNVAQVSSQLTSVDRIMVTALDVIDNCYAIMTNDDKKQSLRGEAVELATKFLTMLTPVKVKHHVKDLLMTLLSSKQLYHIHKDQALLAYAISNLSDMSNSQSQEVLDNESFYDILCSLRAVAVGRPYNLMHFADNFEKCSVSDSSDKRLSTGTTSSDPAKHKMIISDIIKVFWLVHYQQPKNPSVSPVTKHGFSNLEFMVQAVVDIVIAFASSELENAGFVSNIIIDFLLCEDPQVSFMCKQALARSLKPLYRSRGTFISTPPRCSTPEMEKREGSMPPMDLDVEGASGVAAGIDFGAKESASQESVAQEQSYLQPSLDIPPDVDDETMIELAIALSLQDQNQSSNIRLHSLSLASGSQMGSNNRTRFSDNITSAGASDDEGSTAATDGSTLRTPPAEQGASAADSESGSGADSIAGEHNVSGRSSATGDIAPSNTLTGCEVDGDAEMDNSFPVQVRAFSQILLEKLLQCVHRLRDIGGFRGMPFLQVLLMLASDLEGEKKNDQLTDMISILISELEIDCKNAAEMTERSNRHELQLVIMRMLSIMMSHTKSASETHSGNSTFLCNSVATSLLSQGALPYCLQILKSILEYWRHYQVDESNATSHVGTVVVTAGSGPPKGGLLMPRPTYPLPNMSPFFLKQYVKGHANDIFEAYPQLLTEMVLRLPYQIKKTTDLAVTTSVSDIASPSFNQEWLQCLCEYMIIQQTPFVRKQVRKLLLFISGSKERYRQLRDLYILESKLKEVKDLCIKGGFAVTTPVIEISDKFIPGSFCINLTYDNLSTMIEHLRSCLEIATSRTGNWQQFCIDNKDVVVFLFRISCILPEGVTLIILQLLQYAICSGGTSPQTSSHKVANVKQTSLIPKDQEKENTQLVTSDIERRCIVIVIQVSKNVSVDVMTRFIRAFLLESNQSAVRWQAHSLLCSIFTHSDQRQQQLLLDAMWTLWPQLFNYVKKASQFVDLLGYFTLCTSLSEAAMERYVANVCMALRQHNNALAFHPNATLYSAFQKLMEFDGYYLEAEPCLACSDPEVSLANVKLSSLKMDSCYTTTTQIVKLTGSYIISKIVLRISDLKRAKMVRTVCFYYNNRTAQAVVELKNKPAIWHKAKRFTLNPGQTELKVEFPLPIEACNIMFEYADFYDNIQASAETLQCPRCSASVPANPGVCANCGENVFQCHKCRAINYDEKDPFLCNTCGFCKYAKFDYTLLAKSCCAVDPVENEEDRKKAVTSINTLLEKADRVYRQLVASKPALEGLLSRINDQNLDFLVDDAAIGATVTSSGGNVNVVGVNKIIQQLAQKYCVECKSASEDLGKLIQKVLATRKELVNYDRIHSDSKRYELKELDSAAESQVVYDADASQGRCYGCATAAVEHCIVLLRALATNPFMRQVECGQKLVKELVTINLHHSTKSVYNEVRQLLCLLTRDNQIGTDELNSLILEKISYALSSGLNSYSFITTVHHEMALLACSVEQHDTCWEQRLRCVMYLFMMGVKSKSPVVMSGVTLPCLSILHQLIQTSFSGAKKMKQQTADAPVIKIEGNDSWANVRKWLLGESQYSFQHWKNSLSSVQSSKVTDSYRKIQKGLAREQYLINKYGYRWLQKTCKGGHKRTADCEWLERVMFEAPTHFARQAACAIVESLCSVSTKKKHILDMLTEFLDHITSCGENAEEFLALYQNLIKAPHWKSYLAINGVLPHIGKLINLEINRLSSLEETTLKSSISQGYSLKMLTELLSSFIEQDNIRRHYKTHLLGTVLNGYLSLRKLVIQRSKLIDATQEKLLELLEEMTTGNEDETRAFMSVCVETAKKYPLDDYRSPVFIFERLCSIIYPEENDIGEFFINLEKDSQQEDFLQGRMLGNPYSSNDPGLRPLMRDIKNKICQDCELVALLEDDNGMELLVNNKIISLDLPVKEVYKKVWIVENAEGDPMRIVYRMRGLLGDATEEFIESLDARNSEEINSEEVFKRANWMADCGGLEVMIERLETVFDLTRGRSMLTVLLKLFGYCTKVKRNRQKLVLPNMNSTQTMLATLRLILDAESEQSSGQSSGSTFIEQLLQIMEDILLEASNLSPNDYIAFSQAGENESDISLLLGKLGLPIIRNCTPLLVRFMRVIPFLVFANQSKMQLFVDYFKPCSDFNSFDIERNSMDEFKMECLCIMVNCLERNTLANQLKDMIVESGIVDQALDYIQKHSPRVRSETFVDSDELKEFISKPALKYILRLLTGLSQSHEKTQKLVSTSCIPIIHRLEQISSDEHVGSLAENLMEALKENLEAAKKIEEARRLTRSEKKRLAMAMREKQLAGLGMSTNEKGQVTAKGSILQQMEELSEESGLVCVICREGYRFQPNKVIGIYTFTKRCNADDFENKPRKTTAYSTVTHFNAIHIDCHMSAVRLARSRDEWESAALQNGNTKCNGLLPTWGLQVPESAFASCLARHNTYLQECTGYRDIGYSSTIHDLKLLLLRFANEKSFSEDCGGGGPQSNIHIIPYLLHMALYVINTTRTASKEEKMLNSILEIGTDKYVENSFIMEGPLYWITLAVCIYSPKKWNSSRFTFLKQLLVLAHARHLSPRGDTKLSECQVREYSVYKPLLVYFGLIHGIYTCIFKKLSVATESDWPTTLAEFIRKNDQELIENGDKLLKWYKDDLLPCQTFDEFWDVVGLLEEQPDAVRFVEETLKSCC